MKNLPLTILSVVAIVALIIALALFSMISGGLFRTYDFNAFTGEGTWYGPEPWVALIPFGVGILASVGALVLWGSSRRS